MRRCSLLRGHGVLPSSSQAWMANSILSKECCIPRQTWFGVHSSEDLPVAGLLRIHTIQIFWAHAVSRLHLHHHYQNACRYQGKGCILSCEKNRNNSEDKAYDHIATRHCTQKRIPISVQDIDISSQSNPTHANVP